MLHNYLFLNNQACDFTSLLLWFGLLSLYHTPHSTSHKIWSWLGHTDKTPLQWRNLKTEPLPSSQVLHHQHTKPKTASHLTSQERQVPLLRIMVQSNTAHVCAGTHLYSQHLGARGMWIRSSRTKKKKKKFKDIAAYLVNMRPALATWKCLKT